MRQPPRGLFEHRVTRKMAMGVIYFLEVVQVKHKDRGRHIRARRTIELMVQQFHNRPAVPKPGEDVMCRLETKFFARMNQAVLERQNALADQQPRTQFIAVERFGQIVIGPASSPRTTS